MTVADKKQWETWFYLVSIIAIIYGGLSYVSDSIFQSNANAKDIVKLKSTVGENAKAFEEIRIRLTHIEDAVIDK